MTAKLLVAIPKRAACVVLGLCALAPLAHAQGDAAMTEAAAAAGMPAARPAQREIGADTRAILSIQREGTQAGPMLPMHGEQAALGYERYLNSFRFALPEFYTGQANASTTRAGSAGQMLGGK